MIVRLILCGLLAGFTCLTAPPDVLPGDLPSLARTLLERNPTIAAKRATWQAAIAQIPQATALPDPMLRYDWFGDSVETRVGPQEHRLMVSQPFPFPGTLKANGDIAAHQASIAHHQYDSAVRDAIVELKISLHELAYIRQALAIIGQHQPLLDTLTQALTTRYATGDAKLTDLLKAQAQAAQLTFDSQLLADLEQVEVAKITALLDLPSSTTIGPLAIHPAPLTQLDLPAIETLALGQRQELTAAQARIDKTRAAQRRAKLQNRPRFTLDASWIATGEADTPISDSGKDPWTIGFGITIPIWKDANDARTAQARAELAAAEATYRQVAADTRTQLRTAWFKLTNARRLVLLYQQTLLPQATRAIAIAEQQTAATDDAAGLLETQSTLLNFTLASHRAAADYQQAVAQLERLIGAPLPTSQEVQP